MNNLAVKLLSFFLTLAAFGCVSGVPDRADALKDFIPIVPVVEQETSSVTGSIFNDNQASRRFGYKQNYRVGDILTVILSESTQAQRKSGIGTVKEGVNTPLSQIQRVFSGGADSSIAPLFLGQSKGRGGRVLRGLDFNNQKVESKGTGSANQAASLAGAVAVTVTQVLPNNSLLIQGQKNLSLTEGSETVRIRGVISKNDIQPDNTVLSSRIANAQISYKGAGNLADVSKLGWGTKVFNKVWPF
ncbi:flagellar basal body L-ring protein FlgH [Gammaproteobacteria bacterium]|nr:flagellar basal body L-ring protein FlgH [Gammaproteobacteria bacterium]